MRLGDLRKTLEAKNSGSLRKRNPRSTPRCALYSRNASEALKPDESRTFVARINRP